LPAFTFSPDIITWGYKSLVLGFKALGRVGADSCEACNGLCPQCTCNSGASSHFQDHSVFTIPVLTCIQFF
jgi:hypothetical protein